MAQIQFRSDDTVKWKEAFGDGSDGDKTYSSNHTMTHLTDYTRGNFEGTSGSYAGTVNVAVSAGDIVMIHKSRGTSAGTWQLNKILTVTHNTYYDLTFKYPLVMSYTDSVYGAGVAEQSQLITMPQYNNFTINSGVTLTAESWGGSVGGIIPILAKGTVTITGTIKSIGTAGITINSTTTGNAVGVGFYGGYGRRGTGTTGKAQCGEGSVGAGTEQYTANGNGGGGASGDDKSGGGGGHASAGGNGQSGGGGAGHAGVGGTAVGNTSLTTLFMGGGGGGGAEYDGGRMAGSGGGGGGIVLIIGKEITVSGSITTVGGVGGNGDDKAAGGGGSGGSVLIKAQIATLGTNKILASGGAGGNSAGISGGAGSAGRIHLDYSTSYTGTTTPTINVTQDSTIKAAGNSAFFQFL